MRWVPIFVFKTFFQLPVEHLSYVKSHWNMFRTFEVSNTFKKPFFTWQNLKFKVDHWCRILNRWVGDKRMVICFPQIRNFLKLQRSKAVLLTLIRWITYVINWPPGSGSGSRSLLFIKDSKKFRKKFYIL
jgi:hypothetical protein